MTREAPYNRTSPIISDPNSLLRAEPVEQLEHVFHDMFERIIFMA
jgi:hypothetical protein